MGDFARVTDKSESQVGETSRKPLLIGVIMSLIGLLAPVLLTFNNLGFSSGIGIQSMLWNYSPGSGFMLIPPYMMTAMFPFILLRFVPVLQLHRYYKGKTTRRRTLLASLVGDGYFLIFGLPIFIISLLFASPYLMIPLPLQMIFAILILWRYPLPEPTTPWDGVEQSKSWWEKTTDSKQEKADDNELW